MVEFRSACRFSETPYQHRLKAPTCAATLSRPGKPRRTDAAETVIMKRAVSLGTVTP
jgi:hypothetical protein